jgi:hypothetical protein
MRTFIRVFGAFPLISRPRLCRNRVFAAFSSTSSAHAGSAQAGAALGQAIWFGT